MLENEGNGGATVRRDHWCLAAARRGGSGPRAHSVAVAGKTEALRALPVFAECREEDLLAVAETSRLRRFARGQNLLGGGDREGCVMLAHGRVKNSVLRADMDGELIVDVLESGSLVSDACWLAADRVATIEAVALEACTAFFVPRRALANLLEADGRVATRFLGIVATRHARATALALQNASLGVGERLYCRLAELAHARGRATSDGIYIAHGLTQRELGAFSSASRENVNRHLNEWRERGWIEISRHSLLIRDAAALSHSVSAAARAVGFGGGDGRVALR